MLEKLSPETVVKLLNDYFESMVEVVFRNHGTQQELALAGEVVFVAVPQGETVFNFR
jgi:class 3 adenylate cyclase